VLSNGTAVKRPDTRVEAPAPLFAALGDPMRLRIVIRLARGESLSIKELASGTKVTRQAVTKHLHVLASAGVAVPLRVGREQRWALDREQLAQARLFLDRIAQQWDDALGRLKALVEEPDS
jgi:DNA-binding transcriptional ArsR family regulator